MISKTRQHKLEDCDLLQSDYFFFEGQFRGEYVKKGI
jgi:hypothetical protein